MKTPPFLWGVATSAYQIEGAAENDWTEWERDGRLRDPHARCGQGSGHRRRWRSDFSLLASLRANAYRYSLERSAIEPERGRFSDAELALERERAVALLNLDIEPCVTLHHYTHPLWFWTDGGWENPESIAGFRRYAEVVADALGPRVHTVLSQAEKTGLPIIVTENGIATRDDRRRQDFLREHALVLAHRRTSGTRIDGYFYWSLLDNFEWLEGFGPRFGLFEVDYATFARRRRDSADVFARLGRQFTEAGAAAPSAASRR